MEQEILTLEQQATLKCLELSAQSMSREQLIAALKNAWERKMIQGRLLVGMIQQKGIPFRVAETIAPEPPASEEDLIAIFGEIPTEEEVMEYMCDLQDDAVGVLDFEEIIATGL